MTQKDINIAVWTACESLRGVMDAAGYKDYILNLNIPRYVDSFEEAEIDIKAVQQEINKIEGDKIEGELVEVRSKMAAVLQDYEQ